MDKRPHDFPIDSNVTAAGDDFSLDALNASLQRAVWLADVEPWSLEDCLDQARAAQHARTEEPTVVCALAQLTADAFMARVRPEMPRPCGRCAMEATLNVCASCQAAPVCPLCRMCWGCYGGWLPEDEDDAEGGAS